MSRRDLAALSWSAGGVAVVKLAGIASGVATARLLGPAGRGELVALLAWLGVFAALGACGVDQATCVQVGQRPASAAAIVRAGWLLAAALGVAACVAMITVVGALAVSTALPLALVAASLPLLLVGQVLAAADQGAFRFRRRALLQGIQPIAYVTGIAAVTVAGVGSVTTVAASYLIAAALAVVVRLRSVASGGGEHGRTWHARRLLTQGLQLQLPHLAATAIGRIELVIAAAMFRPDEVGHYSVAFAIAFASAGAMEAHGQIAFAHVAAAKDPRVRARELRIRLPQALILALAAGAITWIATPWIVITLFGPPFAAAIVPARWLIAAWTVLSLALWIGQVLRATGRAKLVASLMGAGVVAVAIVGPVSAAQSGPTGLAAAMFVVAIALALALVGAMSPLLVRTPEGR